MTGWYIQFVKNPLSLIIRRHHFLREISIKFIQGIKQNENLHILPKKPWTEVAFDALCIASREIIKEGYELNFAYPLVKEIEQWKKLNKTTLEELKINEARVLELENKSKGINNQLQKEELKIMITKLKIRIEQIKFDLNLIIPKLKTYNSIRDRFLTKDYKLSPKKERVKKIFKLSESNIRKPSTIKRIKIPERLKQFMMHKLK